MKHRLLLLGLGGLLACTLACDSASPVAPTGTVLSVTASPTQIRLSGESSRITVTGFKPDGNPLNPGTQILVSADIGNLYHPTTGELVSIIEIANSGQAVALLRGDGRVGSATVTATLTTGGEASATATVQIGEADTSRPSLIISANPTIIDVLKISRIDILARNSDGTPVGPVPQRIRLTSNLGTLHDHPKPTTNSPVITSKLTDANGEATVYFLAREQSGTGQVSAILGTSEEATVSLEIRDVATDFSFLREPSEIQEAGGTIQLTANVTNARNEGVRNILVRFGSEDSNEVSTGGSFEPSSAVLTDAAGVARTRLILAAADVGAILGSTFFVTATVTIDNVSRTQKLPVRIQGRP